MGRYSAAKDLDLTIRKTWYLIANRTEARIYQEVPRRGFGLVGRIGNPEGRNRERELGSDRPGRIASSAHARGARSTVRHGLGNESAARETVARRFAARIVRWLEQGATQEKVGDLVLVAEPGFLGMLRGSMPRTLHRLVGRVLGREFPAHVSDRELRAILRRSA